MCVCTRTCAYTGVCVCVCVAPDVTKSYTIIGSAHAQDLKRLLFDSSVPQTIFLPDPGGGSFPVAV